MIQSFNVQLCMHAVLAQLELAANFRLAACILADVLPRSMIGYCHYHVICLSVCLSVTKCIVAKRYVL